jgi:hypothetical protein
LALQRLLLLLHSANWGQKVSSIRPGLVYEMKVSEPAEPVFLAIMPEPGLTGVAAYEEESDLQW